MACRNPANSSSPKMHSLATRTNPPQRQVRPLPHRKPTRKATLRKSHPQRRRNRPPCRRLPRRQPPRKPLSRRRRARRPNLPRPRSRRRASDMELQVTTLDGKKAGSVTLSDAIFGLEPRTDIIHRCVVWQLAKRQRGTHEVKNRSDIMRTGKKMYRQKGTGSARHGPARVNLFRGGGRSFGPTPRSHATGLPKKVRALALKHALSAKARDGGIIVLDKASVKDSKTAALQKNFSKLGLTSALIIDGAEVEANFARAARNIPDIDVLPVQGINV